MYSKNHSKFRRSPCTYLASFSIIEALDQLNDGAFSTTTRPHQCYSLSMLDVQVQLSQHLKYMPLVKEYDESPSYLNTWTCRVTEDHIPEPNISVHLVRNASLF